MLERLEWQFPLCKQLLISHSPENSSGQQSLTSIGDENLLNGGHLGGEKPKVLTLAIVDISLEDRPGAEVAIQEDTERHSVIKERAKER